MLCIKFSPFNDILYVIEMINKFVSFFLSFLDSFSFSEVLCNPTNVILGKGPIKGDDWLHSLQTVLARNSDIFLNRKVNVRRSVYSL